MSKPGVVSPGMRLTITLAVISATLMEVLDTSIVNVALPHMQGELGATLDEIGWVATGYIISNVIVLPLTGWLSDYFGRKRYLGWSIVIFTVASLGCGLSTTLNELVAFRILQGVGGAAFLSVSQATLMEVYPPQMQGFAQAIFGIGVIMAPTVGPTLGGILTDRLSWQWIFFVNLPVGVLAGLLTFLYVPDSPHSGGRRPADFVGIGFMALSFGCLQTVLERGQRLDWFDSTFIRVLTILSAVSLVLFVWWELRPSHPHPAVNLRLLRNRSLGAGTLFAFALGLILYGTVFVLPQFLQSVQDHSAEQTGILLIPGGLASAAMMPVVGALSNRIDRRLLVATGALLVVLSMWQFSVRFVADTPDSAFFWPLIYRGAGIGLQFVPLSLVALGTLPPRDVSQGAGLFNLARQLGGSFGIAILATMLDRRERFHFNRITTHVTVTSPETVARLKAIGGNLMAHHRDSVTAHSGALRALFGQIATAAELDGFIDMFRLIAWLGLGSLVLLLLFERSRRQTAAHV